MSRTLVLSDIHANAPALDAVLAAEPDCGSILNLGDIVDCGPHPEAVCERLRELDVAAGVCGNHDRAVLEAAGDEPIDDPNAEWLEWTYDRLSAESRAYLRSLPRTTTVRRGGRSIRLHHGDFSPPADRDVEWSTRVTPDDDRAFFETVADRYDEDVIVHGHSHFPFEADVAGTTFLNPGSVGLQRPGWPVGRARYAVLEDGRFDLRSVSYDAGELRTDLLAVESPYRAAWERLDADAGPA